MKLFGKCLLILCWLCGIWGSAEAKIGIQNPSRLIYSSGTGDGMFIVIKDCFVTDREPSQDCDKVQGRDVAKPGAEDLPAIVAMQIADFLEAGFFSPKGTIKSHSREKIRYLGSLGRQNLDADLSTFEKMLTSEDVDSSEIESIRKEVDRLQAISESLRRADGYIAKISAPEMELVTPFNQMWKTSEAAFRNGNKRQLIYDRSQRLWVRFLGEGDYYDATGTTRVRYETYRQTTEANVDQTNLGGCTKAYGPEFRLPSSQELKVMRRNVPFLSAFKELFAIDIEDILAADGGYIARGINYRYEEGAYRATKAPIICVQKSR